MTSSCVCRPQTTIDQVYAVIRSLLPTGTKAMKTIKMADIEELATSKVGNVCIMLLHHNMCCS